MKKFLNIATVAFALAVMLSLGCVEEFEANISDKVTDGLVVEGDIISDSTVFFRLSKPLPLNVTEDNEELFSDYLNVDAELSVKGSDGTSWRGYRQTNGRYFVPIGTLKPEVEYHLEILYQGDTYQSQPQKPLPKVGIENVSFSQTAQEGSVSILLDTEECEGTQYFSWYFEEDWEVRAQYPTSFLFNPERNRIEEYEYPPVAQGWCYNGTDQIILGTTESNVGNRIVGKAIQTIPHTDHRLSVLYSIRIEQRNLTRQEYEYYQVRAKLNSEMGGLFTPQPSELPTNITCSNPDKKVIGYVGCNMGIAKHQLYISEDEVFYLDDYDCDAGDGPDGNNMDKYSAGYQVSDKVETKVEWARVRCVDVRTLKADPHGRPSWWPNPYIYYKEQPGLDY